MSTKLFTVIIHYRDYRPGQVNTADKETRLKNITEADLSVRWRSIFQSGIKLQQGPTIWEVIPPARITQVFIEQQPETL